MVSLENLAKKLLKGKEITLDYWRKNDGTRTNPDIIIFRTSAIMEESGSSDYKDIVVYMNYENDKSVFDGVEIYRMPVIDELNILKPLLKYVKKQAHSP